MGSSAQKYTQFINSNKNKTVDKTELSKGQEVEKEHTSDPKIAKKIAKDHIIEAKGSPLGYYEGLEGLEEFIERLKDMKNPQPAIKKYKELTKDIDKTAAMAEPTKPYKAKELANYFLGPRREYDDHYLSGEYDEYMTELKNKNNPGIEEELQDLMFAAQMLAYHRTGKDRKVVGADQKIGVFIDRVKTFEDMFTKQGIPFSTDYLQGGSNWRKPEKIVKAFTSAGKPLSMDEAVSLRDEYVAKELQKNVDTLDKIIPTSSITKEASMNADICLTAYMQGYMTKEAAQPVRSVPPTKGTKGVSRTLPAKGTKMVGDMDTAAMDSWSRQMAAENQKEMAQRAALEAKRVAAIPLVKPPHKESTFTTAPGAVTFKPEDYAKPITKDQLQKGYNDLDWRRQLAARVKE